MTNLSALGAIHSPIDADRDPSAYTTDYKALGLPDHSPFAILERPLAQPKPPRPRKVQKTKREMMLAALEDKPSHFNTPIPSREESDKTLAIRNSSDIWFLQRQAA